MWRAVILSGIAIAAVDEEFLARHRIVPPRIVADLVDEPQSRLAVCGKTLEIEVFLSLEGHCFW